MLVTLSQDPRLLLATETVLTDISANAAYSLLSWIQLPTNRQLYIGCRLNFERS